MEQKVACEVGIRPWPADNPSIAADPDASGFKAFTLASVPRKSGYVFMMNGDNAGEIFKTLGYGDTLLKGFVTG